MNERELIVRIDSTASHDEASLLVYRLRSHIEFVVTEKLGGDASVLLSKEEVSKLLHTLASTLRENS